MINTPDEISFMERAVALSARARLLSPPNPWVGAVVVKDGKIVGEGHTQPPGGAHAEVVAIQQAAEMTKSASLFVTLEPCSHHGRTPPCTEAIIQAGIKKVFVGLIDPDPNVSGSGIAKLRDHQIAVQTGLLQQEIASTLAPYLFHREKGRPYIVLKSAMSLDGRIAAKDYSSKWISSEEAREDVQKLRAESQAILIGANTARFDKPRLTVRSFSNTPLRVVYAPSGDIPEEGPLFDRSLGKTLIYRNSVEAMLEDLAKQGVIQLLVEGGSGLNGLLMSKGLVNQIVVYIGPRIIGDQGIPLFRKLPYETLTDCPELELVETKQLGQSCRLIFNPRDLKCEI